MAAMARGERTPSRRRTREGGLDYKGERLRLTMAEMLVTTLCALLSVDDGHRTDEAGSPLTCASVMEPLVTGQWLQCGGWPVADRRAYLTVVECSYRGHLACIRGHVMSRLGPSRPLGL